jgi:uncharacterized protein (UPF0332 family)
LIYEAGGLGLSEQGSSLPGKCNAAKTHRGVRAQFSRLAQHEARIDTELLSFLREGYQLKAVADYGVGQATDSISSDDAASAIAAAGRFVECIAAVLS